MTENNQKPKRKRKSNRQRKAIETTTRGSKTICLPIERENYNQIVGEATDYRAWIDEMYAKHPELFPQAIAGGYRLHDRLPLSKKLADIQLRRLALKTNGEVYSVTAIKLRNLVPTLWRGHPVSTPERRNEYFLNLMAVGL